MLGWAFDGILGITLLWLAWRALASPDLFKGIVLFITFGLLMALAWVRLEAPDVALAEAAIGAGLTGALLLTAYAKLRGTNPNNNLPASSDSALYTAVFRYGLPATLLLLLFAGLVIVLISLHANPTGLTDAVMTQLEHSGVSHPVTAVLLNFRGYDTLLEMVVLLLAVLGVWALDIVPDQPDLSPAPVLDTLMRLLIPLMILVAGYLLWAGAHAPGGAFQAGSVIGAAGVLLLLAGWQLQKSVPFFILRLVLVAGPAVFISIAFVTLLTEQQLLTYPPEHAGLLILLIETVATVTIGVTLMCLFLGYRPEQKDQP